MGRVRGWVAATLLWAALLPAGAAAAPRVALVVGNAGPAGPAAAAVKANAALVADALGRAGLTVTLVEDPSHAALAQALERFRGDLAAAEFGLVYYAGPVFALGARSFLVPADARMEGALDVVVDAVALEEVLGGLRGAGRPAAVLIDPTAGSPPADRLRRVEGMGAVQPAPVEPPPAPGLLVGFAQQPGRPAAAPPRKGAGRYAAALAQAFARPGIELDEALHAVADSVAGATKQAQKPWHRNEMGTSVRLVPAAVAAAPVPAPAPVRTAAVPPPPAQPDPAVEPADEMLVAKQAARMRGAPAADAPVLRTVPAKAEVRVTGRVKGGSWVRVESAGASGFMHAGLLAAPAAPAEPAPAAEPPAAAPVQVAAAAPPPEARQPEPRQPEPREPEPREPEPAQAGAPQPQPRPAEPPAPTPGGSYEAARATMLFAQPAIGARGLRQMEAGEAVTLLDVMPDGAWARVRDGGDREGYMSVRSLQPADAAEPAASRTVAMATAPPPAAPPPASPPAAALPPAAQPPAAARPDPTTSGLGAHIQKAVATATEAARLAGSAGGALVDGAVARAEAAQAQARRAAEEARRQAAGPGAISYAGGAGYRGQVRGQIRDGLGVLAANGERHEGEWRNDRRVGHGVALLANGDRYEGSFQDDRRAGFGVLTFANGDVYRGEVAGDRLDGHGEMRFANGHVYRGELVDNRLDGYGEMRFANGDRYVGRFVDGQPAGHGELVFANGQRFVGGFREGRQGGPGLVIETDGRQRPGVWVGTNRVGD